MATIMNHADHPRRSVQEVIVRNTETNDRFRAYTDKELFTLYSRVSSLGWVLKADRRVHGWIEELRYIDGVLCAGTRSAGVHGTTWRTTGELFSDYEHAEHVPFGLNITLEACWDAEEAEDRRNELNTEWRPYTDDELFELLSRANGELKVLELRDHAKTESPRVRGITTFIGVIQSQGLSHRDSQNRLELIDSEDLATTNAEVLVNHFLNLDNTRLGVPVNRKQENKED